MVYWFSAQYIPKLDLSYYFGIFESEKMAISKALIKATPFQMHMMEKADQVKIGCNNYKIFCRANVLLFFDVIVALMLLIKRRVF